MVPEPEWGRGQSEVVGVVLLTGVIVVVVALVGTVVLGSLLGAGDREPLAAISGDLENKSVCGSENVTLRHAGGDSLAAGDLTVILRNGDEERVAIDSETATFVGGQAESGQFSPGDVWTYNHSQSGLVRINVVDRGSGTTIYTERCDI